MAERKPLSGARAKLFANGRQVGWATGVSAQWNQQLQRIDPLGTIFSEEIEPVSVTVSVTADFVRIIDESLATQLLRPRGDTAAHIQFPEITMDCYDTIGDKQIYRIIGAKMESLNWRVDRQSVMTNNATFQARQMQDEVG